MENAGNCVAARRDAVELRDFARHVYVIDRRSRGDTLQRIADRIGRSRERVRQMEAHANYFVRRDLCTPYVLHCLMAISEQKEVH